MNIKNTTALLLILVMNTANMYAMEVPCSGVEKSLLDMEEKYGAFLQTPQYQNYERAKKLYEKHKTEETRVLMEEAAGQLLETKEGQLFIQTVEQKETTIKAVAIVSDNMIIKNRAMINTQQYLQYQEAVANYEQCKTSDTLYIVNMCKIELLNTKEYQEFAHSTQQDMRVVKNITKSHHWLHVQKPQSSSELYNQKMAELKFKENKDAAWLAVTKTKEHQLFKQAKIDHERYKTLSSSIESQQYQHTAKTTNAYFNVCNASEEQRYNILSSSIELKRCKHAAKATNAYFNYCKASEEKRQLRVIESAHEQCLFDYRYNEKMIKKLNYVRNS